MITSWKIAADMLDREITSIIFLSFSLLNKDNQ